MRHFSPHLFHHERDGFTLLELLIALAVTGILVAIAAPAFSSLYADSCLKTTASSTVAMMREAKQQALGGRDHAIFFDVSSRTISLLSDRGPDDKWRTADDTVKQVISLPGSVCFGYGSCGPIPGLATIADGVSFQNNTMVCNSDLTGSAGAVYFCTSSGSAMALTVNSSDFSCTIRRWDGTAWTRQ